MRHFKRIRCLTALILASFFVLIIVGFVFVSNDIFLDKVFSEKIIAEQILGSTKKQQLQSTFFNLLQKMPLDSHTTELLLAPSRISKKSVLIVWYFSSVTLQRVSYIMA